jgi:hypothetical protein
MSSASEAAKMIGKMGFDRVMAQNLIEMVQISVEAGRQSAIDECVKIAEDRAIKLRAKAKAVTMPSRQSYFAQAIEARAIADLIRAVPTTSPVTNGERS